MFKRWIAFILVSFVLIPFQAYAQAPVTMASAEVDLWPEYDQPSMLVIYHLTLPSSVSLPFQVTARIPASVGSPNAVAARQPDGSLFNLPFDQQSNGEWNQLSFRATTPEIQIEYYDNGLTKDGAQRHFEYHWPGDYAVDSLVIQVQQPVGATNMQISPSLGTGQIANDGLTYYTADVGALSAGQSFTISLDYQKNSDELSASTIKVQPSAPINDTQSGLSLTSILPWILGAMGLVLIVGGGIWYWQSGREPAGGQASRRHRRPAGKPAASGVKDSTPQAESSVIYCHQCGKRAAPGDRFCRTCGTELRTG